MNNREFIAALADDLARLPTLIAAERVAHLRKLGPYLDSLERRVNDYRPEESFRRGDPGHPDNDMGM